MPGTERIRWQGDLLRVNPVGLHLPAVDRLPVQRVPQHEGDALPGAEVGQPIPGEDTLDRDRQIVPVGGNQFEEAGRIGFDVPMNQNGTFLIDDADVHLPSVQIDAAVIPMLPSVKWHGGLLRLLV
jgi:hypothetical protein